MLTLVYSILLLSTPTTANEQKCKDMKTATECLTCNCFHESRGEPLAGIVLVNRVVISRVRARKKYFSNSICGVIKQKGQFSWWLYKKNRNQNIKDKKHKKGYNKCLRASKKAQKNKNFFALYYHTTSVKPKWAKDCKRLKTLGNHIFYKDCSYKQLAHKRLRPASSIR